MVTPGKKKTIVPIRLWLVMSLLASLIFTPATYAQDQSPTDTLTNIVYLPFVADNAADVDRLEQAGTGEDALVEDAAARSGGGMNTMTPPAALAALEWQDTAPTLSAEAVALMDAAAAQTNLPGPHIKKTNLASVTTAPDPLTASPDQPATLQTGIGPQADLIEPSPAAAPDAQLFRNVAPVTTSGSKSTILEASVAVGGKNAFFTGNWFAARSTNGGSSWTYVNPTTDMTDFCCDQVTIYDEARNVHIWYRQGTRNTSGVNRMRVGISSDGGATFCNYDFNPTNVDTTWTNQWFDYPHLQLGADFLYITTNIFNNANPAQWQRSLILRMPLDSLATCSAFNYWYYWNNAWFTFIPTQGADHVMYFASDWPNTAPQNSRINIWTWPESVDGLPNASVTKTVTAWTATNGNAVCGSTAGNWAARADQRLLSGARYMIHGTNLQIRGRKVIAWWWNVAQGGNFARPYIESAAFYEDTLVQVAGNQGRPNIWNSTTCYLYPSAAANKRGDLGLVLNYSSGTALNPSVAFAIADDYVTAAPGYTIVGVRTSTARPSSNTWGDYNTVRTFYPTANTWVGGAHYINSTTNCSNCGVPIFFAFGRGRDFTSWNYWQNK